MAKSLQDGGDLYFPGSLCIENNVIRALGDVPQDFAADVVIDAAGKVVMPGFVNCHTHAAMTLLRSYADDLPLMHWLEKKIWPLEAKLEAEDIYWGTLLACREMIGCGTTTFADMYFFMEEAARAVADSGIRASLSRGLIGVAPKGESALEESKAFIQQWHGKANGRITTMLGPHAPYTCPPDYLEKVMQLAEDLEVGIHIHVAETRQEVEDINRQYGKSPVELLDEVGLFQFPVLAAHCVHVSEADMEILREKNVKVAHNPESNMKLASGIAPVPRMLAEGITVGLGTDGAASNNNLDLLEEMRSTALLHKVSQEDPTVISAYQALEMATKYGGQALGLPVGVLAPGKQADVILIDLRKPHLQPLHDIPAHIVYAAQASDVDTVIVNGEVVMENRQVKTVDEEQLYAEITKRAGRLVSE
ncbi:MAG: amidohydrolase [Thermoanaerobacteraceae bacterium]|nr:amidohydrolase [Thermoanaerobacteraceae bacterium]